MSRICFWHSDKDREVRLADAVLAGAKLYGHDVEKRALCASPSIKGYDVGCFVGVKSKRLFEAHRAAGIRTLLMDKGYTRHRDPEDPSCWEYWRISLDAHHPTETTLMRFKMDPARFDALGLEVKNWRKPAERKPIIIAGSSGKYHEFHGLPDPTEWTGKLVRQLAKRTQRPLIYRPKSSWRAAVRISGTLWGDPSESIFDVLADAHCLITHGSNACFESLLAGVPSLVLGDGIASPLSRTSLDDVGKPYYASVDEVCRLACAARARARTSSARWRTC